jgi:hypothetical protein
MFLRFEFPGKFMGFVAARNPASQAGPDLILGSATTGAGLYKGLVAHAAVSRAVTQRRQFALGP